MGKVITKAKETASLDCLVHMTEAEVGRIEAKLAAAEKRCEIGGTQMKRDDAVLLAFLKKPNTFSMDV